MTNHLEWLESQARLARQQIERQPEVLRRIYEADLRAAMSGRGEGEGGEGESLMVSRQVRTGTF